MNLDKTVCQCMKVTNGQIKKAVEEGARTLEDVQDKTNVGRGCKRCIENVQRVIDEFVNETENN